jgi:serine/threonine-protein kinase
MSNDFPRLAAALADRYRMERELGRGGMATVYLAEDLKHHRKVAIKVLRPELAAALGPERFLREITTTANLRHPHILPLYDSGRTGGRADGRTDDLLFYVMPYVDGESLRDRLTREKQLPIDEALRLTREVADALDYAHGQGVIHRDIKPENILLERGHAVVADFGIARAVSTAGGDKLTQTGMAVGTPVYMSPEQSVGESDLDGRSDLYALGCVLYEMLAGEPPYTGGTAQAIIAKRFREPVPRISTLRETVPPAVEAALTRVLAKSPSDRFATAEEFAAALTAPADSGAARPAGLEEFWIAVLPFKYSGANAELTALAEGLSEGIVTGLSRFSYLRVIARGATLRYLNEVADVRTVGKELGARYVMEGSLRQAGARLRITVQLVDATTGAHLWAETYERSFIADAVFELQDDLIPRIVSTCADRFGVLARSISDAVRGREPGELGPYEALMRGFGYHHRLTPVEHAEAREALERAVDQAPANADCWAMLSWVCSHEHAHGFNVRPGSLERALVAARRAVDIAPSNHLAQQALAVVLFFRKETAGCLSAAERAIALNPLDASNEAIFLITFTGQWERGCALIRRAMELNPHHPRWYGLVLGINEYRMANYCTAVDEVAKANAPEVFWTNVVLAAAHGQLGELTAARSALRDLLAQKEDFAQSGGQLMGKWWDAQLVGHLREGLRKAGLDIAPEESAAASAGESSNPSAPMSAAVRAEEGFWVAVMPFNYGGTNPDLTALAEGISEEIARGLSRFSYLRVIARSSTLRYRSETVDVRAVGKELGARYVMEGSLRLAGSMLRVSVQLVDATSGAQLWAETYDRPFSPEAIFALQDELVPRIVSSVADAHGILPHTLSESLRSKQPDQLTPYEAVLRSFGYGYRMTPEEHATVRACLERAVQQAPGYADAWGMLSLVYTEEFSNGFNARPDPLGRALQAARRAADAAPSSALSYNALARALFFRKEFQAFRTAADRAIELNPLNGPTVAGLGGMIAYAGDWEHGCALVERAARLNPRHPGGYWFALFYNAYRQGDYRGALSIGLKINLPDFFATHEALAAVYGQLGEHDAAAKSLRDLLRLKPDYAVTARAELGKWFDRNLAEHQIDGLRKAGLDVAPVSGSGSPSPVADASSPTGSGAVRTDEGFWVAVLPFKYSGTNPDLTALAEALSEEIVTGLSRFSYLRVVARNAALRYTGEAVDSRDAGQELGARYVMEGSLRQAGTRLRIAAQLVDATTGAHLWAENYERGFSSDTVFELQDDLVSRIVSTVADSCGVLPRSMSMALRSRPVEQLSPYEAVLRSFSYSERGTADELAAARSGLELAVGRAPAYGDAWAMLALLCVQDYAQGFNLQADSLTSGLTAARRAVEAGPASHLAHCSLAQALFFHKEYQSFQNAAERAVALNPMDGYSIAFLGELLTYVGESERGLALARRAKQLNPNHPGWYWYADFYDSYRRGDDRGALGFALKVNLPGHWFAHASLAAAYGQLGEGEAAAKSVRELLKVRPDFAATVRKDIEKWWHPEYVERLIDGWRKAGLEIAPTRAAATPAAPKRPTASPDGSARPGIAVLPFANMSADPADEFFADGITEEIINALAQLPGLRVAARTSCFAFKGKHEDLRAVADKLGVGTVMEGSVRKSGTRLRITAQLINAGDGCHLWSERYDRELSDVFALQDEIANAIAQKLELSLGRGATPRAAPASPEVYQLILKGKVLVNRRGRAIVDARGCLERAVSLDPGSAEAHALLGDCYRLHAMYGIASAAEMMPLARAASERALALDPGQVEALATLANLTATFERDLAASTALTDRALARDPAHVRALCERAIWLSLLEPTPARVEQSLNDLRRARGIDPLNAWAAAMEAFCLFFVDRPAEALAAAREAVALDPDHFTARWTLVLTLAGLARHDEALAAAEPALLMSGRNPRILAEVAAVHAARGDRDAAEAVHQEVQGRARTGYIGLAEQGAIAAAAGHLEEARRLVEKAVEARDLFLLFWKLAAWAPLRTDPEGLKLLRSTGPRRG